MNYRFVSLGLLLGLSLGLSIHSTTLSARESIGRKIAAIGLTAIATPPAIAVGTTATCLALITGHFGLSRIYAQLTALSPFLAYEWSSEKIDKALAHFSVDRSLTITPGQSTYESYARDILKLLDKPFTKEVIITIVSPHDNKIVPIQFALGHAGYNDGLYIRKLGKHYYEFFTYTDRCHLAQTLEKFFSNS